jgi:hypothetical protein
VTLRGQLLAAPVASPDETQSGRKTARFEGVVNSVAVHNSLAFVSHDAQCAQPFVHSKAHSGFALAPFSKAIFLIPCDIPALVVDVFADFGVVFTGWSIASNVS